MNVNSPRTTSRFLITGTAAVAGSSSGKIKPARRKTQLQDEGTRLVRLRRREMAGVMGVLAVYWIGTLGKRKRLFGSVDVGDSLIRDLDGEDVSESDFDDMTTAHLSEQNRNKLAGCGELADRPRSVHTEHAGAIRQRRHHVTLVWLHAVLADGGVTSAPRPSASVLLRGPTGGVDWRAALFAKTGGEGGNRTRAYRFCRPVHYHFATSPLLVEQRAPLKRL